MTYTLCELRYACNDTLESCLHKLLHECIINQRQCSRISHICTYSHVFKYATYENTFVKMELYFSLQVLFTAVCNAGYKMQSRAIYEVFFLIKETGARWYIEQHPKNHSYNRTILVAFLYLRIFRTVFEKILVLIPVAIS